MDGESVDRDTTGKRNLADGTYNFTITGPKGYQNTGSIVVTNGVAVSNIILNKLIPGEYVITESESENGTVLSARSGGVNSGENGIRITVASHSTENVNIAAFTNNINTTSLEISKTIVSPMISEKTGKQFTFTVKVTKADGNPLTGTFGSYTFNANGETSVTTTGEETITISGLPQGATYTVTETADNDFNLSGSSGTTGTLGDSTATASFTNSRKTGNLTISKTVRNHDASTRSFTFTVEVKNADGTAYTESAWLDEEKTCITGNIMCNPILQAKILNNEKTDLNVIIGLCVGHDSLFYKYSDALCTTLVTKDKVLAHNPVGALYQTNTYYKKLMKRD